jgi:hypothetical protein
MSMPLEQAAIVTCTSCEAELRHCHGTAIVVEGGAYVCSDDPNCTLEIAEHWYVARDES